MLAVGILGCSLGERAVWESAGETGPQPRIFMGSQQYRKINVAFASCFSVFVQRLGKTQVKMFTQRLPFI